MRPFLFKSLLNTYELYIYIYKDGTRTMKNHSNNQMLPFRIADMSDIRYITTHHSFISCMKNTSIKNHVLESFISGMI